MSAADAFQEAGRKNKKFADKDSSCNGKTEIMSLCAKDDCGFFFWFCFLFCFHIRTAAGTRVAANDPLMKLRGGGDKALWCPFVPCCLENHHRRVHLANFNNATGV